MLLAHYLNSLSGYLFCLLNLYFLFPREEQELQENLPLHLPSALPCQCRLLKEGGENGQESRSEKAKQRREQDLQERAIWQGGRLLCWGLRHCHPVLKSGSEVAVAMRQLGLIRQSHLIKMCPELPLLLLSQTQALVYSLEDHHEEMQAQMGALAAICAISLVRLLA